MARFSETQRVGTEKLSQPILNNATAWNWLLHHSPEGMRSSDMFGCCHRNHTGWGLPQAWVGGLSLTRATHTHRLSRHLGQWQTAAERGGADPGCCALHSKICHFRRLQTRFTRAIRLKPHGDTRQELYKGKRQLKERNGSVLMADSFHWQLSLQTIFLLVLKSPFPNWGIKSWHWLFLPFICPCLHSSWEGRGQEIEPSLPKGEVQLLFIRLWLSSLPGKRMEVVEQRFFALK